METFVTDAIQHCAQSLVAVIFLTAYVKCQILLAPPGPCKCKLQSDAGKFSKSLQLNITNIRCLAHQKICSYACINTYIYMHIYIHIYIT